jgi:putative FmdB family regulatory protein
MTYEYLCQGCGHEWEAEQTISEAPLKLCPKCGESRAKRQVSGGAGFILKGGGWYADGYGTKKPAATDGQASSKKDSSTRDSSKADSKEDSSKDGSSKEASIKEGSTGTASSDSKTGAEASASDGSGSNKAQGKDKGGSGSKESAA